VRGKSKVTTETGGGERKEAGFPEHENKKKTFLSKADFEEENSLTLTDQKWQETLSSLLTCSLGELGLWPVLVS